MTQLQLFPDPGRWWVVERDHPPARQLADRHYSRQSPGAHDFMAAGRTLVMLTDDGRAVWGAIENYCPGLGIGPEAIRWRVAMFRNEGAGLSSELIAEATRRTLAWWDHHYGGRPPCPLTTEIDTRKVRRKRDPGRCFRRAGWQPVGFSTSPRRRYLFILQAPE